jgi:hypothetical protein
MHYKLKHLWRVIKDFPSDLWWNLKNYYRWAPILWNNYDFDWAYMARIMEFKLRLMIENTDYWHVVGAEKSKREMQITAHLLKRLIDDDYQLPFNQPWSTKLQWKWTKHVDHLKKHDLEMLSKMLNTKMLSWWD